MSFLRRLGKKTKLLPKILRYFPDDIRVFIDLFMGSGAVSFVMTRHCQYVFANDNDAEVFNLFMVVKERKQELIRAIEMLPYDENLWNHWKTHQEVDPVWKAARFLMLSNFGFMGMPDLLLFSDVSSKQQLLQQLAAFRFPHNMQFLCCDFREVFAKISLCHPERCHENTFVYVDAPYVGTVHNYQNGFTEQDSADLFEMLCVSGWKFARSEFDSPLILKQAEAFDLNIIEIGERQTLKSRQTEILITNFETQEQQMSIFETLGGCNF